MDYARRVALITGASSGIGRQLAHDFARRGARLLLVARREARLREVANECEELGTQAEIAVGDLADRSFCDSLVPVCLTRFERLDVLINNAGVPKHKLIYDIEPDEIEHTFAVNFLAAARLCCAAIPPMLRRGEGWIVNISSAAGRVPPPRESVYAASKYALTGFTEGLALDLAGSNIHPAVVHVGPIDTEIWQKAAAESPVRYRGRKYSPQIVSDAVFRCIEQARYELTVPGSLRLSFWLKALLPGVFRRGAGRWDPVPAHAIASARAAAQVRAER